MTMTVSDWLAQGGTAPMLYAGEAADGLRAFLDAGGRARVAYLDPPFLTGKNFGAYRDDMNKAELLGLLRVVLTLCREALEDDGSLYLHVDHRISAHARLLLDEVFGDQRDDGYEQDEED
jgi:adenine-specific DNA-methyltransferase